MFQIGQVLIHKELQLLVVVKNVVPYIKTNKYDHFKNALLKIAVESQFYVPKDTDATDEMEET